MRIDVFDALPWALCMIYIIVAPFSKVEESFNTQATHDILYHGLDIEKYDHNEFPGVVPRTFIGAAVVSLIAYPLNFIAKPLISNIFTNPVAINGVFLSTKLVSQIIVRMVLGSLVCAGLSKLRHSFSKIFGERAGIAFMLINSSQFHLLFYASRFLPNVFALGLFLFGLAFWMENNTTPAIALFTFATGVFRSELIIFVGPILLEGLFSKRTTFTKTIIVGLVASAVTLAISFGVDSYFWQRPLWPEGAVFWYNTYQNKSSDWGVSPFYWYFTSALPRALLTSLAFIPLGLYFDWQRLKHYVIPTFVFLFLYSFLPHKELRFIFYTIPVFNMVAAVGLARLFTHREKTAYKLGLYIGVLLLIANIAISGFLLLISSLNYPGGYALQKLHIIEENSQTVPYVHIDVASAQTGVSLYGEKSQGWRYSKAEDLNLEDYLQFSHLLSGNSTVALPQFELIGAAEGYDGLQLSKFPDIIKLSNKIFIWKNKQWKAPL